MADKQEKVIVTQGRYVASAVRKEQYPMSHLPEIAFIGRSNVGKSSLINSLTRVNNLARVSSQPGKTQTINFYDVGLKLSEQTERRNFFLVDLPGYGYAKVGKSQRKSWGQFIESYFTDNSRLLFVCQLLDIRHAPSSADVAMFTDLLNKRLPVLVVATKADKIGKTAVAKQLAQIKNTLGVKELSVLPYSSLKNSGRSDLLNVIADALTEYEA
ncbi:MAG: YihA family ribosome biogenesis GTP-binding protein [Selenomonadaceae bacterium]|nr:YihA family ribosome biogenesis GTP-binding protein [Selenomonadaceae bacterium]